MTEYESRDEIATNYGEPIVGFADASHPYIQRLPKTRKSVRAGNGSDHRAGEGRREPDRLCFARNRRRRAGAVADRSAAAAFDCAHGGKSGDFTF